MAQKVHVWVVGKVVWEGQRSRGMWLRKPKKCERELWTRLGSRCFHPEQKELVNDVMSC